MSTADEIAKLHDLLTRGAITQAEFEQAKARLLSGAPAGSTLEINLFRLSESDRWLGGVCGGIGRSTGVDSWVWRLIFAVTAFMGGAGVILYLLLWIFVPREGEPPSAAK
jgi:phage shock protein C